MPDDFDVQRRSPLTPEGQIESAGHFSRGLGHRYGAERVRRAVRIAAATLIVLIVVLAIAASL